MLISLIIPIYNEEKSILKLVKQIDQTLISSTHQYEYVFIDDGSADDSKKIIQALPNQNKIILASFSRNFGKESAIYAGLSLCNGDAAIILDADLQHPVELILQFIEYWEQGYQMVYGVMTNRTHENRIKKSLSNNFYKLLDSLTETKIPKNAGDFRLVDKKVITALLSCKERNQFMKGLYNWVGFKSIAVPFSPNIRLAGKSKWPFNKLMNLAITGITSFSNIPLRLVVFFGFIISFFSFMYGTWIILEVIIEGIKTPGFATIMCTITFLGGVQLIATGIVGEYIASIFNEVKQRPHYIIDTIYENDKAE